MRLLAAPLSIMLAFCLAGALTTESVAATRSSPDVSAAARSDAVAGAHKAPKKSVKKRPAVAPKKKAKKKVVRKTAARGVPLKVAATRSDAPVAAARSGDTDPSDAAIVLPPLPEAGFVVSPHARRP